MAITCIVDLDQNKLIITPELSNGDDSIIILISTKEQVAIKKLLDNPEYQS